MKCPKCDSDMVPGEAMVTDISPLGKGSMNGIMTIPGASFPHGSDNIRDAEMSWREKTGKMTGWLIKREEEKVLPIKGYRCKKCGYIELYAKK